jgi:hypothetical protein
MLSAQSVTLRKVANVPNNRHRIPLARARQEEPAAREGIENNRTYRRAHLIALLPGGSEEFLALLEEFYGLIPLGGRQPIYFGQNVLESLLRHAKDERVNQKRVRATRDALRQERQRRRHGA